MIPAEVDGRMMSEFRTLSLDLRARMASIDLARAATPALFSRAVVEAVREFGATGLRQRGGTIDDSPPSGNARQVGDELQAACARVAALTTRLQRGTYKVDPLVLAGAAIHEAMSE